MKVRGCFLKSLLGLLFSVLPIGAEPVELGQRVQTEISETALSFDRQTREVVADVSVAITNQATQPILEPFRLVIRPSGGNVTVVHPGLAGSVDPYDAPWIEVDLGPDDQLEIGSDILIEFTLRRPFDSAVAYGIEVYGSINQAPVVTVAAPVEGVVSSAIRFDATESEDPEGNPLTYAWDFGDGTISDIGDVEHTYSVPGQYEWTLTVADPGGIATTRSGNILVAPEGFFALARTRILGDEGIPLGGGTVIQTGPDGTQIFDIPEQSGFVSIGGLPGDYLWKFTRNGYLPVWREGTLVEGAINPIPSPRHVSIPVAGTSLSPISEGSVETPSGSLKIAFAAGAFPQASLGAVQEIGEQNLPFPLPRGWRPTASWLLYLGSEPISGGTGLLTEDVEPGVHWVRFDEGGPAWTVVQTSGDLDPGNLNFPQGGFYSLVAADGEAGTLSVGDVLPSLKNGDPDPEALTASGSVNPETGFLLGDGQVPLARGEAFFDLDGPGWSGMVFPSVVEERYRYADGKTRFATPYEASLFAYRQPGLGGQRLRAVFPLRPVELPDPSEIESIDLSVRILKPASIEAVIFDATGGVLRQEGIEVGLRAGLLSNPAVVELIPLNTDSVGFPEVDGLSVEKAFSLNLPNLNASGTWDLTVGDVVANEDFLLIRVIDGPDGPLYLAVGRFGSDGLGKARSLEPLAGGLPGIVESGVYLLLRLPGPAGLLSGQVLDGDADPVKGAQVTFDTFPWSGQTDADGGFRVAALPGTGTLRVENADDGEEGSASFALPDAETNLALGSIDVGPVGPRIVATDPLPDATGVRRVSSVAVTFSEPVNPASWGANAFALFDPEGTAVAAALSLGLSGKTAELFPENPLAYGTTYTAQVDPGVADLQGIPLEGGNTFEFTTEVARTREAGAQLVIYEPGAEAIPQEVLDDLVGYDPARDRSIVVARGTSGSADPEVPVILYNDITGETSTVLSKPDGSFAGMIPAEEDDYIKAVFVNQNGSRNEIGVTRQLFDDGTVGLYRAGGILEAESDGKAVEVIVEPNAIEEKNRFKVERIPLATLLSLLGDNRPSDSDIVAGFRLEADTNEMDAPVAVALEVDETELSLPEGVTAEESTYQLLVPEAFEGIDVFRLIDKMEYKDGKLRTASPPFPGFLRDATRDEGVAARMKALSNVVISGRVLLADDFAGTNARPIEGAAVFADSLLTNINGNRSLLPGSTVAISSKGGGYAMLLDGNLLTGSQAIVLAAQSPRYPGNFALGTAIVDTSILPLAGTADLIFLRGELDIGLDDILGPTLQVRQADPFPQPGVPQIVTLFGLDDGQTDSLEATIEAVVPYPDGEDVSDADLTLGESDSFTYVDYPVRAKREFTLTAAKPLLATIRFTGKDSAGNESTVKRTIIFGQTPPADPLVEDENDTTAPYVLNTVPIPGDEAFNRFRPVQIQFNEPIDDSSFDNLLTNVGTGLPLDLSPLVIAEPSWTMSEDKRTLTVLYPDLSAGENYTLTIPANRIRDINGNQMDQDLSTLYESDDFSMTFRTRPLEELNLTTITNGGGSAVLGDILLVLDRGQLNGSGAKLEAYQADLSDPGNPQLAQLSAIDLPPGARTLTSIPGYSFRRTPDGPVMTADLVAVGGGTINGSGQFLWIYDYSDPTNPNRISSGQANAAPDQIMVKLDWSPPLLAYLMMDSSANTVGMVDLQLMILAQSGNAPEASVGQSTAGLDLNGDGDYVDEGEQLPKVQSGSIRFGLTNGGLVQAYSIPSDPDFAPDGNYRILDFDLEEGGRFLGIVAEGLGEEDPDIYRTVIANGIPVADSRATEFLSNGPRARRVTVLRNVVLDEGEGLPRNLALVSNNSFLSILDITNPRSPSLLSEVDFGSGNSVFSVVRSGVDQIAVSAGGDLHFFQLSALGVQESLSGHPAYLGRYDGMGTGSYAFDLFGTDLVVANQGGTNRVAVTADLANFATEGLQVVDYTEAQPDPVLLAFYNAQQSVNEIDQILNNLEYLDNPSSGLNITSTARGPQDGLLEVVIKDKDKTGGEKRKFSADFNFDTTPPNGFPIWTFDGGQKQRGKNAEFLIPKGSWPLEKSLPLWPPNLEPKTHLVAADVQTMTVKVYPADKKELKIDLAGWISKFANALDSINTLINVLSPPTVPVEGKVKLICDPTYVDWSQTSFDVSNTGPQPVGTTATSLFQTSVTTEHSQSLSDTGQTTTSAKSIKIKLINQWKEIPGGTDSNKVFLSWKATAGFDPLAKVVGRIELGYDAPLLGEMKIFFEGTGTASLIFAIARDYFPSAQEVTAVASAKFTGALKLVLGATASLLETNITFQTGGGNTSNSVLSATIDITTPIKLEAEVSSDFETAITHQSKLTLEKVTGNLRIQALGGWLRSTRSITLIEKQEFPDSGTVVNLTD